MLRQKESLLENLLKSGTSFPNEMQAYTRKIKHTQKENITKTFSPTDVTDQ
jgi:hypothetical protein